jgi:hypothetical protein
VSENAITVRSFIDRTPLNHDGAHRNADEARRALDALVAENQRLRKALERIYQQGKGLHVEIARDALNGPT